MATWIPASERLPEVMPDQSKDFFCRNRKDGSKKVLWYGKSTQSFLASEPWNWEWLEEAPVSIPDTAEVAARVYANDKCKGIREMKDQLFSEHEAGLKIWDVIEHAFLTGHSYAFESKSIPPSVVEALENANPYTDPGFINNELFIWKECVSKLRELLQKGGKP